MTSHKGKNKCVELLYDVGNGADVPNVYLNSLNDEMELKIGMTAENEEEAYDMYNKYAYNKGFSIRKSDRTFKRGTCEIIGHKFVCWKEGLKEFTNPSEVKMIQRLDTRCGCKARVFYKVENGVYQVSRLITEHNHPLVEPNQRHLLRSTRKIHDTTKGAIKSMADAGIRTSKTYAYLVNEACGYENVGFTERDCHNFVQVYRAKKIETGDCQNLMNYFKQKCAVEQMFFYAGKVDEENRMSCFFWRDGLSKLDYECFGDVVIFDATYRTNKYNMICAPFVGTNHHWQIVLFGCAFLSDEKESSFTWLFEAFLESMNGKAPKTIFTDQDGAMANAINKVFPHTRHRLCQWHICQNANQNINSFYSNPEFKDMFAELLYVCESEIEFDQKWAEMAEKWNCSKQPWLCRLHNIREKWAPAFSRDTFSANIRSSQRSESMNNVFQHMACMTMTLTKFVHHYEKKVEKMREAELICDYQNAQGKPRVLSNTGILYHARKVYTHKLFGMFQHEFLESLSVEVESIHNETHHMYRLKKENSDRENIVQFNSIDFSACCNCKHFESKGLLCLHALRVLNLNGVKKIPEQYILRRWTKAVKDGLGVDENNVMLVNPSDNSTKAIRLNKLMRKAFSLLNFCANLDVTTEFADHKMDKILWQAKKMYAASIEGTEEEFDDATISLLTNNLVHDPHRLRKKGQKNGQTYGRKKAFREKKRPRTVRKTKAQQLSSIPTGVAVESSIMRPPNPSGMQLSGHCPNQFSTAFAMPPRDVHTRVQAMSMEYFSYTTGGQDCTNMLHFSQEHHE